MQGAIEETDLSGGSRAALDVVHTAKGRAAIHIAVNSGITSVCSASQRTDIHRDSALNPCRLTEAATEEETAAATE